MSNNQMRGGRQFDDGFPNEPVIILPEDDNPFAGDELFDIPRQANRIPSRRRSAPPQRGKSKSKVNQAKMKPRMLWGFKVNTLWYAVIAGLGWMLGALTTISWAGPGIGDVFIRPFLTAFLTGATLTFWVNFAGSALGLGVADLGWVIWQRVRATGTDQTEMQINITRWAENWNFYLGLGLSVAGLLKLSEAFVDAQNIGYYLDILMVVWFTVTAVANIYFIREYRNESSASLILEQSIKVEGRRRTKELATRETVLNRQTERANEVINHMTGMMGDVRAIEAGEEMVMQLMDDIESDQLREIIWDQYVKAVESGEFTKSKPALPVETKSKPKPSNPSLTPRPTNEKKANSRTPSNKRQSGKKRPAGKA